MKSGKWNASAALRLGRPSASPSRPILARPGARHRYTYPVARVEREPARDGVWAMGSVLGALVLGVGVVAWLGSGSGRAPLSNLGAGPDGEESASRTAADVARVVPILDVIHLSGVDPHSHSHSHSHSHAPLAASDRAARALASIQRMGIEPQRRAMLRQAQMAYLRIERLDFQASGRPLSEESPLERLAKLDSEAFAQRDLASTRDDQCGIDDGCPICGACRCPYETGRRNSGVHLSRRDVALWRQGTITPTVQRWLAGGGL